MEIYDGSARRLLTLAQVADARGVTVAAVTKARQRGTLPEPLWLDDRTPLWLADDVVPDPVPVELRVLDRWVCHNRRKVPVRPNGKAASSTDPGTWCSYEAAKAARWAGVGFALDGDGIVCLDLDHCLVGGAPTVAASRLLDRFPATYVEVSRSGEGLHVFGYGDVTKGWKRTVDGVQVESYSRDRFIYVTGRRWSATSALADLSAVIGSL
jgi:primase-polymerase (primpol)-like protein